MLTAALRRRGASWHGVVCDVQRLFGLPEAGFTMKRSLAFVDALRI
jgi:hypothetical protein